jgi:hypothetical protein
MQLRLHYERWKALRQRPFGMGAFYDFALAAARLKTQEQRPSGRAFGPPRRLPLAAAEQAIDRWYGEGGNTQTRIARRARAT